MAIDYMPMMTIDYRLISVQLGMSASTPLRTKYCKFHDILLGIRLLNFYPVVLS